MGKRTKFLSIILAVSFLIVSLNLQQVFMVKAASEESVSEPVTTSEGSEVASAPSEETLSTSAETSIETLTSSTETSMETTTESSTPTDATSSTTISTESSHTSQPTSTPTPAPTKGGKNIAPISPATLLDWMPDTNLQAAVASALGIAVADLTQAEMLNLTDLYLSISGDINLTGLEYATNLLNLSIYAEDNTVTNLNLGAFPNLIYFNAQNLHIASLDFSGATKLETIGIGSVKTNTITIVGLLELSNIYIDAPSLSSLTLNNLPQLNSLSIDRTNLTALTLSDFPALTQVYFQGNSPITNLTIQNLPILSNLFISGLKEINQVVLNNLPELLYLSITNSSLAEITIQDLPTLKSVDISYNEALRKLSFSNLPQLRNINVNVNLRLTTFTTYSLPNVDNINLSANNIQSLILADLPKLSYLYADENQIVSVDLKNMPILNYLSLSYNAISDLRNIQLSNVLENVSIYALNQIIDNPPRASVNQPAMLPSIYDEAGNIIPWQLPGTEGLDFTINSVNNITWLTGGIKHIQLVHSLPNLDYSAIINLTVLHPDADGWTLLDGLSDETENLISNTFTRSGYTFRVDSGASAVATGKSVTLNENQRITNLKTGEVYTYTYRLGKGTTSYVWNLQGDSYSTIETVVPSKVYIRINGDGSEDMRRVDENTTQGFKVETITRVTAAGEIRHNVEVTNTSGAPMTDVELMLHIDTELNLNDRINIYATGGGGVYMEGGGITLFGEPLDGTTLVYGGKYNIREKASFINEINVKSAWGHQLGDLLVEDVDSAMYFGPDPVSLLADGQSISFSYQERIFTEDEPVPPAVNSVQVSYVDESGKVLAEEVLQGSPGETFTTTAKTFANYELLKTEGPLSGTFTFEPQYVTYTYGLLAGGDITVRYVDQNGNPLIADIVLTGKVTMPFTTEEKTFDDYSFIRVDGSPSGVFTLNAQQVTYHYQKNAAAIGGSVKVKYVDQDGKNLISPITIPGGIIGTAFTTEKKVFKGYKFIKVEGSAKGTFTVDKQSVIYHYKQDSSVIGGNVTVRYLDQDGKALTGDIIIPGGNIGDNFTTEQKTFPGYDFVSVDGSATGKFAKDPQTVTYHYKAQNNNNNKNISKTGESRTFDPLMASIVGIMGLMVVVVVISKRYLSKKK